MSNTLAIVGRVDDEHVSHLAERARAVGHSAHIVDLFRADELPTACDAVIVRAIPSPSAQLAPPDDNNSAREWYVLGKKQRERASLATSLLLDLEARGGRVVNPLSVTLRFDHKPLQLMTFARAGLPIPRTLVTRDLERARAFVSTIASAGGDCIAKPVDGGAPTIAVDLAFLDAHASDLADAPVILQERIRGDDLRVTIVNERVVSAVVVDSGDAIDSRVHVRGYRAVTLAPALADVCVRAVRACGLAVAGVDCKGGLLLEVNSAPGFLAIERATGVAIGDAIVAAASC